jgi:hypothetical protein
LEGPRPPTPLPSSKTIAANKTKTPRDESTEVLHSPHSNMAFHNLCSDTTSLPSPANLLGLDLKYCIESPKPYQELDDSIKQMQGSIQLHFCFAEQDIEEDETDNLSVSKDPNVTTNYIPSLYI